MSVWMATWLSPCIPVSAVVSQKYIGASLSRDRKFGGCYRNIPTLIGAPARGLDVVLVVDELVTHRVAYKRILVGHFHLLEYAGLVSADGLDAQAELIRNLGDALAGDDSSEYFEFAVGKPLVW